MWRKPTEAKPSAPGSNPSAAAGAPATGSTAAVKEGAAGKPFSGNEKQAERQATVAAADAAPSAGSALAGAVSVSAPSADANPQESSLKPAAVSTKAESPLSVSNSAGPSAGSSRASYAPPVPEAKTPSSPISADTPRTSAISAGLRVRGEILGDTDLFIDGQVHGKIHMSKSLVTVGPNGRVQGDIEAREIVVEGVLEGNLNASHSVKLAAGSRVQAGILSPRIAIADGAKFRGKVEMVRASETSANKTPGSASTSAPNADGGSGRDSQAAATSARAATAGAQAAEAIS